MKAQPEVIDLDVGKLEALLAKIEAELGDEVAGPFRALLHGYQQILKIIQNKELTLQRLRQLLFGAKTESARNVLGPDRASAGEGPATTEGEGSDGVASASLPIGIDHV